MKTLVPYLTFAGQCREAVNYYKEIFNGEIVSIQTFEEARYQGDDKFKQNIIHAEFKAEGVHFMASDGMPDFKSNPGNNVSLSVDLTDEKEMDGIFAALAKEGTITMPLDKTFWNAKFGMLKDRYGINWMFNCYLK